ncbi:MULTISPECIES: dihydrodipicolinate synthase family protein [Paenibacillus]|uniref:Dihydrodipicolinate synthetase n=1 Tax=Paenibacillus illinoisensis TaxID=59845 RepID=A0A2W0C0M6_9BACL|nr:dihydrodipicolinate synthase family protein [Paenibacillus illinoisensis]PYY25177.1 Dihydrodipicolinate synthetase [Paenibacillus illinoisensis]
MFHGLAAFPLTPMNEHQINERELVNLIERLVTAGVSSIGALGSTGNYAYLNRSERFRVLQLAVGAADSVPVMTSISAIRTADVFQLAEDAQRAGAQAVLLAPVSYQTLTEAEVYSLYEHVTASLSVPLCVYDNPITTHFHFTDELHARIAGLPLVKSIKIPGVPSDPEKATERVNKLRELIPSHVTIGVSGDPFAVTGLNAGCEVWYSVLGGLFPKLCLRMTQFALEGRAVEADYYSVLLEPIWKLFRQYGSLRVAAAAAEIIGLTSGPGLPLPLQPLHPTVRDLLNPVLAEIESLENSF